MNFRISLPFRVKPLAVFVSCACSGAMLGAWPLAADAQGLSPLRVHPALLGLPVSTGGPAPKPASTAATGKPAGDTGRGTARSGRAVDVGSSTGRSPAARPASRSTDKVAARAAAEPSAAAPVSASWAQRLWQPLRQTWDLGTLELYLPLHTHHLRSAYTKEQIAGYQENPPGLGVGFGRYNEKGNWEGVYAMGFHDSHFKPQWMAGYGWKTFWNPVDEVKLGLGYTAFLMTRADIFDYKPFPGILPIASIGYRNLSLETAFVPGGAGAGNVFFFWAKWEFGKAGEPIGTPAAAPAQEQRPQIVAGPYRTPVAAPYAAGGVPASAFPAGIAESAAAAPDAPPSGGEPSPAEPLPGESVSAAADAEEERVDDGQPPLSLRLTKQMGEPLKSDQPVPVFLTADRLYGDTETEMVAEGDAELRKRGMVLSAERLTYSPVEDEVTASGKVRIEQGGDVISGPYLRLRLQDQVGFFEQPSYTLKRQPKAVAAFGQSVSAFVPEAPLTTDESFSATTPNAGIDSAAYVMPSGSPYSSVDVRTVTSFATPTPAPRAAVEGHGQAERIDFEGENQVRISEGTYSTCKPGNEDWYAQASELKLDYDREVGEGRDGKVYFKGVPILYSPWLTFPLNNQRKSGFLAPTFASSTTSGLSLNLPYYWNIAPNMDATIAPRILSKRGVQLNTDFRYLDYNYSGRARLELLPNDLVSEENRWGLSLQHRQVLAPGLSGRINFNAVSDDKYYTELSSRITNTAQTQLLRRGVLDWAPSDWWTTNLKVQSYQTLQPDPATPVTKPYSLLPQINFNARKPDWYNTDSSLFGQYSAFAHTDPSKAEARRLVVYPQVALPIVNPGWYVTPKLGVHATHWSLSRQDASAAEGAPDSFTRTLPVFSVDAGMTFERPFEWAGQGYTQTLEPRLYYLNVPYRDQSRIPIFDSGLADFNFAQIFAENQFTGQDRFNDANQLTAALSSRLIAPDSGREVMRAMLGQRFYFSDQQVTLPTQAQREWTKSDLLAAFSGEVAPKLYADAALQYNLEQSRAERTMLGARYLPAPGKVFNASYRFNRDQIKQVDFSGQWPIYGGWYAVGRFNYSLKEQQPIENVLGFEYDGGCWALRMVGQRLATATGTASTAFFVQLELNDFSRIGSNPLTLLRRSIQGYGRINDLQTLSDPALGQ